MAWQKIATKTLTVAGDSINTDTFTTKKFLQTLCHAIGIATNSTRLRFNNDATAKYAQRYSNGGAADSTIINFTDGVIWEDGSFVAIDIFGIVYTFNLLGKEKLSIGFSVVTDVTGAGTAPRRFEIAGKYVPSPDADITQANAVQLGTGDLSIDANLSVLGTD